MANLFAIIPLLIWAVPALIVFVLLIKVLIKADKALDIWISKNQL